MNYRDRQTTSNTPLRAPSTARRERPPGSTADQPVHTRVERIEVQFQLQRRHTVPFVPPLHTSECLAFPSAKQITVRRLEIGRARLSFSLHEYIQSVCSNSTGSARQSRGISSLRHLLSCKAALAPPNQRLPYTASVSSSPAFCRFPRRHHSSEGGDDNRAVPAWMTEELD